MNRYFSVALISVASTAAFAQHATHKANSASQPSREVSKPISAAVQSKAQSAAKFQQVALALNLNALQKKSVGNLLQDTRRQLQANSNSNISPAQHASAAQTIKSEMVQKFVAMLTPQQKQQLAAMLMKRQQQQSSSGNSLSGSSGSAPSAPDMPSVDAPDGSDSGDAEPASSASDAGSGDAASGSSAAGTPAAAATTTAQAETAKPSAAGTAKSGPLSDEQLAAILNSFVQDDQGQSTARPVLQHPAGNPAS